MELSRKQSTTMGEGETMELSRKQSTTIYEVYDEHGGRIEFSIYTSRDRDEPLLHDLRYMKPQNQGPTGRIPVWTLAAILEKLRRDMGDDERSFAYEERPVPPEEPLEDRLEDLHDRL